MRSAAAGGNRILGPQQAALVGHGHRLRAVPEPEGRLDELLDMLGPQQQQEIQTAIHDGQELVSRANAISVDAQSIVTHIREGRGTVGALLMDEEIYDDVTEMLRDLKHNPWKLFWRE